MFAFAVVLLQHEALALSRAPTYSWLVGGVHIRLGAYIPGFVYWNRVPVQGFLELGANGRPGVDAARSFSGGSSVSVTQPAQSFSRGRRAANAERQSVSWLGGWSLGRRRYQGRLPLRVLSKDVSAVKAVLLDVALHCAGPRSADIRREALGLGNGPAVEGITVERASSAKILHPARPERPSHRNTSFWHGFCRDNLECLEPVPS